MRRRSVLAASVIYLLFLFLISCVGTTDEASGPPIRSPMLTSTPIPTVVDSGLAYGLPCRPPCWQELIPGETTWQEAVLALGQLRASGQVDTIHEYSTEYSAEFHVYSFPSNSTPSVSGHFEENILDWINGSVQFYYAVGTLVGQFGGPEGIYTGGSGSSTICSSCEEWEPPEPPTKPVMSFPAYLLYPNQGLYFLMLVPVSGLGCICPEMKITLFQYYSPTTMQEVLLSDYMVEHCISEEDLVEWHGFGGGY